MIAINTPQAIPLALSVAYLQRLSPAIIFGSAGTVGVDDSLGSAGVNTNAAERRTFGSIGLVTGVSAKQGVISQVQNALTNAIYVTPFGDGPGDIAITFISNRDCLDDQTSTVAVIQHYLQHRLLPTRNRRGVLVAIGTSVFRGFLLGLDFDAQGGELPIRRGTLLFKAWPRA